MKTANWDAHKIGNFNELVIVDLIDELQAEGGPRRPNRFVRNGAAVRTSSTTTPMFSSPNTSSPCAFESTHALVKYAMGAPEGPV
jgi:hypothetical protein